MGKSGHFARKVMLCSSNTRLRNKSVACNTVHPITIELKTKEHLKKYKGRTYRLPYSMKYNVLTGEETHLIGKKILIKSPITCACKKNKVCPDCYGRNLYSINKGMNVGALAAAYITNP